MGIYSTIAKLSPVFTGEPSDATMLTTFPSLGETISFSIMEENHARIGRIWIAKPEQELSKEDFAKVKQKLATLQGYYSISKNAFVFKYNPAEVL